MEFKEGTNIYTRDGDKVGEIERVVINPRTKKVSHLVIKKGFIFTEDKVVPVKYVDTANPDQIILRQEDLDVDSLPDFTDTHYLEVDEDEIPEPYAPRGYMPLYYYQPVGTWWSYPAFFSDPGEPHYVEVEAANIPENTVALETGADVYSSNGEKVGSVERILTDATTRRASHIVVAEGLLFKSRTSIPTYWINLVTSNEIHLAVSAKTLSHLPEYEETPV